MAKKTSRKPAAAAKRSRSSRVQPPPVPELSHLQFLVLGILLASERSGLEVRDRLAEFGVKKSGPAFYQLMARLEDAELVDGRYHQQVIDGQIIRERIYRIRSRGQRAWRTSRDFQLTVISELGGQAGGAYA